MAVTLEAALDPHADSLPEGLDLVVSGHMHQFQSVTFPTGSRPPQLVVGNGGVKLATPDPAGSFSQEVDGVDANGLALAHHGFLDISSYDPSTGAWSGQIVDKHDDVIGECGSAASSGSICGLVTGTPPTDG